MKQRMANFRPKDNPRFGIGMTEIEVTMTFKNELGDKLIAEAEKRKTAPIELLADIIEAVINNDLWAALLDR